MKYNFFKMQAQGNDYLYFDFIGKEMLSINLPQLARQISDRHYGVGADGIVLILPSDEADARMRILNADGSEAEMCGSALRSVCGYLFDQNYRNPIRVETKSGIREGIVSTENGRIKVRVDMGKPKIIDSNLTVAGFTGIQVDIGNPHFVIFVDNLPGTRIADIAKDIYKANVFIHGINVEFVRVEDRGRVTVQVWERGSGATLACGTGASAVAFAGYSKGLCDTVLQIDLPGGFVHTEFDTESHHIFLTGEVVFVFDGVYEF
ncbi:MAG TPA: diaminopimelate epimerase [Candidatus Cloacimonadota bacterium]|nr:diaminopimelate epimerase [Candidatus Cloacimonadota bacterium]